MKQPRFKFGDKVLIPNSENPFEIRAISLYEGRFLISGPSKSGVNICTYDDEVGLLVEPQKKKLYAYYNTVVEDVFFSPNPSLNHATEIRREPKYDIEYPVNKGVPHVVE